MIAQRILLRCSQIVPIIKAQHRHVRGVRGVFRHHLPRYKNSLMNLRDMDEITAASSQNKSLATLWTDRVDFYKLYMPMNQQYVLLEALFNPNNDIDRLLRIIDENLPTMNSFYLATAFEALNDMIEMGACLGDTVLVSPEFKNLCRRSLFKLRFFEADEILKVIKCLSSVKMPESMLMAQSALQMARHLINDFSLNELIALRTSLDGLKVTDSSRRSLLSAVRQAVTIRITNEQHHQQERLAMKQEKDQIEAKE